MGKRCPGPPCADRGLVQALRGMKNGILTSGLDERALITWQPSPVAYRCRTNVGALSLRSQQREALLIPRKPHVGASAPDTP